ncbi:hypothetical protein H8E88_08485 [candidate division KSB1 bacterium]|nr:hypothetical protein [candidate division KSB1 bacterium]MBL7095416.1 hypothetical protein [candidate division KSB1 bacterium]
MKTASKSWLVVHIFYPILAFLLEGFIRFVSSKFTFSMNTFSGSTLAMSQGLFCIFVSQSLLNAKIILDDEDKKQSRIMWVTVFTSVAIVCFVLFGLIVFSSTLFDYHDIQVAKEIKKSFEIVVFISFVFVLPMATRIQSSFDLRTNLK